MSERTQDRDQSYHKDNSVRIWTYAGIHAEASNLHIDCMEKTRGDGPTLFTFASNGYAWTCQGINEAVGFLKGFAMAKSLSRMHGGQ